GASGLALVDVGSGTTAATLLDGVRAAGYDPADITHLLLTHIHLDHAGAAGYLARLLPHARVYVHSAGAAHLVDPTKLIRSAARIYGERMGVLWGTFEPVPEERLVVLDEGASVDLGGFSLRALYTPGHAVHHLAYHDAQDEIVFPGDIAGVILEDLPFARPPTPPPDLDVELWKASIERVEALRPRQLLLPHFASVTEVSAHLASVVARLDEWAAISLDALRMDASDVTIAQALREHTERQLAERGLTVTDTMRERLELAASYAMSAQGYVRYFKTLKPDLLKTSTSSHGT
ncbi:MAG TPA: MBL fold metallo-hydrolase, partial [Ktedonobacterales bacterium]